MEKDPYLSELDAIDDLDAPTQVSPAVPIEEPTPLDVKMPVASRDTALATAREGSRPPAAEPSDISEAPVKEILDLSPDLSVPLVVVMGRKNYTVKDLLSLRMGQIMEMDRAPLEPVDILVAGRVIAKGELVDVEGKLGVRILKLLK